MKQVKLLRKIINNYVAKYFFSNEINLRIKEKKIRY